MPSLLLLLLAAAPPAPRVLVIHSAWGQNVFAGEFPPHLTALGWPFEVVENRAVADWIGRVREFDIIVSAGVGNLENAQDLTRHTAVWRAFLEGGGALWITDASYDSVLGQWVNGLFPDEPLGAATCAFHRQDRPDSMLQLPHPSHPLTQAPWELGPLLAGKQNLWAHLVAPPGWDRLAVCADGEAQAVARDVGRGTLLVSSWYSFRGEADTPLATAILDNLWSRVRARRAGLELVALRPGEPRLGAQRAVIVVRSAGGEPVEVVAGLAVGDQPAGEVWATVGGETILGLPFALAERGAVPLALTVRVGDQVAVAARRTLEVPPLLRLELSERHLLPHRPRLTVTARFDPPPDAPLAECLAELLVDGEVALRQSAPPATWEVPVDGAAWPAGEHEVAVRLRDAEATLAEETRPVTMHPPARVHARDDGTLLVDGEPFLPLGWYHVSWPFDAAHRREAMRDIAAAGYNLIHCSLKPDDDWGAVLDEAEALGLKVITEFGVDPLPVLDRFRGHPAVLAWNPGDEPDGQGIPPEFMRQRQDRFKEHDAGVPSFMTLCVPSTYHRYAGAADILAPDPYPIWKDRANVLEVHRHVGACWAQARRHGRTVIAILQCFEAPGANWRVPTFAEVRAMTWLALLAGAKGILYYTYAHEGFRVSEQLELWRDLAGLPPEIAQARPFVLGASPEPLDTGRPEVVAGLWRVDGRALLVAVNGAAEPREVALRPPGEVAAWQVVAGPTPTVADGRLTLTLGPLEVALLTGG